MPKSQSTFIEKTEVLTDFFEYASDLFYIFHADGRLLHANKAFRDQLQYSDADIRKLLICDLVHPDDRTRKADTSQCSTEKKNSFRLKRKDGKYNWYSRNSTFRHSTNLYYIVARNISAEKEKYEAYLKNYYDFTFFLDNSPDPVARFDKQLRHIYVNPATEKFTGMKISELVGKTHYELGMPKELADLFRAHISEVFESGETIIKKSAFPTYSGMQHVEASIMPEFDHSQKPENVLVVIKNITEKEGLVSELAGQIQRLKIIAEIGEMVLKETPIKRLLKQTLKSLSSALKADFCRVAKFSGIEESFLSIVPFPKIYPENERVTVSKNGLASFIMKSEEPVIVKDFSDDKRFEPSQKLLNLGMKSGVFLKFFVHGKPFGFLGVYAKDERNYSADIVLFLRNICNMIATAIEKQEREDFLRTSEKNYRKIFNNSTDLIIVIDQECNAIDINKSAIRFFGYKKENFPKKAPMFFTDPLKQNPQEMFEICRRAFYEKEQKTGWWVLNKHGKSSYLDVSVQRGNYYGKDVLIFTARDRTEGMNAEKEIRTREEKYRTLLETVNDGVVYIDNNLNLLFHNKKFSEMVNIPIRELSGANISEIIKGENYTPLFKEKMEILGKGLFQEFELKIPAGSQEKWFLINLAPISDAGTFTGALVTLKEITKRKLAELRLEEKNKDLNTFIYKVSHDLKGPLASVLGLVNIAKLEVFDSAALNYLNLIDRSTKKLDKTLLDLVELTQIQHGQVQRNDFSLKALAEEVIESLENLENFNKINLKVDISSNLKICSDHVVFRSILQNLIINAYKYHNLSQDSPYVHIFARKHQNLLTLQVEDNGSGIHPTLHKKIFDMFFRGQDTVKGTGLGLFIVKNAVSKLEGNITLKSERPRGSIFTVTIPL